MNVWENIAIPALLTVVALAVLAGWALRERGWWKDVAKDNAHMANERGRTLKEITAERDGLKKQLDEEHETLEERGKLKEQIHTYIAANTKLLNEYQVLLRERNALQDRIDEALRPKPPTDGAVKKPRVSKVKPPLME